MPARMIYVRNLEFDNEQLPQYMIELSMTIRQPSNKRTFVHVVDQLVEFVFPHTGFSKRSIKYFVDGISILR